ncbi:exo-beta-N-acetylmuramidase NamZ domain-containing protein, partial [Psychrobacter sp. TB20-MNA-CIBAN-0197]
IYGKNKKPSQAALADVDVIIFDIQDVGVRFYTYISSMHYMMEAAAEQRIEFLVLDRPNPNIAYVDGPRLEPEFKSFVGMHPIPVLHGMTVGELAKMIKGEG